MVETQLTEKLIEEGRALVRALDSQHSSPKAAFWMFFPEGGRWKLVLSGVRSGASGPREAYKRIQSALGRIGPTELELQDVAALDSRDPVVSLLRTAVNTPSGAISSIRFSNNVVDGRLLPDALVYRMERS